MLRRVAFAFLIAAALNSSGGTVDAQAPLVMNEHDSRLTSALAMLKARRPRNQASRMWSLVASYGPHVLASEKDILNMRLQGNLAAAMQNCDNSFAPAYAGHFSEIELQQQTEFFESPLLDAPGGNGPDPDGKTLLQSIVSSWASANPKAAFQRALKDVQGQQNISRTQPVVDGETKLALKLIKFASPASAKAKLTELAWDLSERQIPESDNERKESIHAAFIKEMGIELEDFQLRAAQGLTNRYSNAQLNALIKLADTPGYQKYSKEVDAIGIETRPQLMKCENDIQQVFEDAIDAMKKLEAKH
ncbi:MAG TPA: hypothetical protein VIJ72_00955 [Rhizomicrobium sp.]